VEKQGKMGENNLEKLGKLTLDNVYRRLNNPRAFDVWIKPAQFKRLDGTTLVIEVPNKTFQRGFSSFIDIIKEEFYKIANFYPVIDYVFKEDIKTEKKPSVISQFHLNKEYTFENFVVGPCNRLAHASALAVAQSPGTAYNPLFLYGGVGLGKTHLMQAIGHFVQNREEIKGIYLPAEYFVNEFIQSIKNKTTQSFRNKFRNLDFILIDDIHFLAGKEGSQEEFFHTFNYLYDQRKQIILSSDRPPKEIKALEKRLISRFEWGLVADLQKPDFETRVAILKKKCEVKNLNLSDDIIFFIAEQMKENVRVLEGILTRLLAYASLLNKQLDKELIEKIIDGVYNKEEVKIITLDLILKKVCNYFRISPTEIKSKKRVKNILIPRQIAMYLGRTLTDNSLNAIAVEFGGKDHTTVLHSCKKITGLIKTNEHVKGIVENLQKSLKD
jgi:chromosomal replication initiator protein